MGRKKAKTIAGREDTIARRIERASCSVNTGQSAPREEADEINVYLQERVHASQWSADTQNQGNVGKEAEPLPEHLQQSLDHWAASRRKRLSSLVRCLDG